MNKIKKLFINVFKIEGILVTGLFAVVGIIGIVLYFVEGRQNIEYLIVGIILIPVGYLVWITIKFFIQFFS